MTTTQESYPPLVGALAALPEHVRSVVVAYGKACARIAVQSDRAAAMPGKEWLEEAERLARAMADVSFDAGVNKNIYEGNGESRALADLLAHLSLRIAPDEAVKDAARYRWLRDGDLSAEYPYPVMRVGSFGRTDYAIWAEELDAAIDSAMEKEKAK